MQIKNNTRFTRETVRIYGIRIAKSTIRGIKKK